MDAFIEIYEGLLGGGKTYSVVYRLFNAACEGRTFITNIEIDWPQWKIEAKKRFGVILEDDQYLALTVENVQNFDKHVKRGTRESPVLLAIDEVHLFFNSRDWAQTNKKNRGILELLTQARKMHLHMILITQHRNNLDKQFVRMVQYFWRCRDLRKWGIPVGPFKIPYPFNQILQICVQSENEKIVVKKRFIPKQKWVFALYKTEAIAKGLDLGFETVRQKQLVRVEKDAPSWIRRYGIGAVVGAILGPVCLGFMQPSKAVSEVGEISQESIIANKEDVAESVRLEASAVYVLNWRVRWMPTGSGEWRVAPPGGVRFASDRSWFEVGGERWWMAPVVKVAQDVED